MGTNTLTPKTGSPTIDITWFNDFVTALKLDLLPRNASGVPTDEAGSVGSSDYQWLNGRFKNIFLDGDLLTPSEYTGKPHRVTAGKEDSNNYPDFLAAAGSGSGLSATLQATTTDLDLLINSEKVTVSSDATFSSLTAAPSSNNTCLINDTDLTGAASSKTLGEYDRKPITIDTIGTEISDKDGDIAAFKTGSEVFLAEIDTSNNKLYPIFRGWAGTSRSALTDNDTITLLAINSLLIKSDGSTKVSSDYYPETCTTSPTAATAGKIYLERSTNKIGYDTGSAIDYSYMLLGFAICDDTDCLYVQHVDIENFWLSDISLDYQIAATTTLTIKRDSCVSVNGKRIAFHEDVDLTTAANMDTGESIAANTLFYIYAKEDGSAVISSVAPRLFCAVKKGFYHPSKYFRCVGAVFTNSSSQFAMKTKERKSTELIFDYLPPVGTIVPWMPAAFGNGTNGSVSKLDSTEEANFLSDNWKICDGSEINDPESPLFNGSGKYLPKLDDERFLIGGTNTVFTSDTVDFGETGGANTHQHNMSHVHQWAYIRVSGEDKDLFSTRDIDGSNYSWEGDESIMINFDIENWKGSTAYMSHAWCPTGSSDKFYTGGGIASPSSGSDTNGYAYPDNAGATLLTGDGDNIPKSLGVIYIMRIK